MGGVAGLADFYPTQLVKTRWIMSQSTLSDPKRREQSSLTPQSAVQSFEAKRTAAPSRLEKWLTVRMLQAIGNPPIALVLWDGSTVSGTPGPTCGRVAIHDRRTLLEIALDPLLYFGEAYSDGRIDVAGSLPSLLSAVYRHRPSSGMSSLFRRMLDNIESFVDGNSLNGSRLNIHHHYDIGDDFYQLWLDREMLYTCAYFPTPESELEAAQRAKMEYVCRKLHLKPGETVVEAGCGWGALARYMARHHGVVVKAYNISRNQIAYARQKAREQGLDGQVEFVEDDYRNISGSFDVFVSVGMLEHVGVRHYQDLSAVVDRCLGDRGRGLIHSIGQVHRGRELNPWIRRRIFPGAYPPALSEMVQLVESAGFGVLDTENLRLHYARTLEHWLARFEASAERVAAMFDDRFVRMWRLYLAGSAASFTAGSLHLFQVVFARPADNEVPWTRSALYADCRSGGQ